jgi:hypothetical protein
VPMVKDGVCTERADHGSKDHDDAFRDASFVDVNCDIELRGISTGLICITLLLLIYSALCRDVIDIRPCSFCAHHQLCVQTNNAIQDVYQKFLVITIPVV